MMNNFADEFASNQKKRNKKLIADSKYLGEKLISKVLPFKIDLDQTDAISPEQISALRALEIDAARTAISAVAELAKLNEVDHMGGGLDLISALVMTLAVVDFKAKEYTIENAHTSIGYYGTLAAYGYIEPDYVINKFRQSLDIAGHVSWLPGGTQLSGGRLGVMIPVATGQALGKKAYYGSDAWVITHCGDAGWISGQALNGFNAADIHDAPITFIMHRNGIQLSGSNKKIMDKDPRPIIESLGISILEIESIHDKNSLFMAYKEAHKLAKNGRPSLIYPKGYISDDNQNIDLNFLGEKYGITKEVAEIAQKNQVDLNTNIWIPGALMSFGDVESMLECVFLVNELNGGKGHHDGHMKGRDLQAVLGNPMLRMTKEQSEALQSLHDSDKTEVVTTARPAPGSKNLTILPENLKEVVLPEVSKTISPRAGIQSAYAAIAKSHPDNVFIISCDLDASTKLDKARTFLKDDHQFEMSIEEQASALMANGLAMCSDKPQFNVFSTFAAFFEGIAREGFEMWRYQRNLTGINEGLNVTFHLSHIGACTGRDHFSGWSLDWITLALGYLPYLHRFYAPADTGVAFLAVKDAAAHYGGHIIGIPRDNLPVLTKQNGTDALWTKEEDWQTITEFRKYQNAKHAILALGAPAHLAAEAAEELDSMGLPTDVIIVNGLPVTGKILNNILTKYPAGIVTIEDGLIGNDESGLRGFAGMMAGYGQRENVPMAHVGITDPAVAPSEGHYEVWEHFGITKEALVQAVQSL
jgi:transketolase